MTMKAWGERLQRAAPDAQLVMVRFLAALLAGPAQSDALLIVADALTDGARELDFDGRLGMAITMRNLGTVLRDEAPRRA